MMADLSHQCVTSEAIPAHGSGSRRLIMLQTTAGRAHKA